MERLLGEYSTITDFDKLSFTNRELSAVLGHPIILYGAGSGDLIPIDLAGDTMITVDQAPFWESPEFPERKPINEGEYLLDELPGYGLEVLGSAYELAEFIDGRYRYDGYIPNEVASLKPALDVAIASLLLMNHFDPKSITISASPLQNRYELHLADGRVWHYLRSEIHKENSSVVRQQVSDLLKGDQSPIYVLAKGDMYSCNAKIFHPEYHSGVIEEFGAPRRINPSLQWSRVKARVLVNDSQVLDTVRFGYGVWGDMTVWQKR